MSDELFSGGGDGGWKAGERRNKRQKVPGRGPGVAQLEKIMRLGDDRDKAEDSTRACGFTFPSHYGPSFVLAPPPPAHPPAMSVDFFRPPPPPMPHGFFPTNDKSKQIWAHSQYPPQHLTSMMNPPFWQIVQASPSSNGVITAEPPSNQRFYQKTTYVSPPYQEPFVCNYQQHPNPFPNHHEIIPRDTNMVKWTMSETGSSFQGSIDNEAARERSCTSHTVPFYNFIQPKEDLKESDHDEVKDGGMDLDLDLKL